MKTLSFRFDIDTTVDIQEGVPKLLELADDLNIRFSFYVNMGKSFSIRIFLLKQCRSIWGKLTRKENQGINGLEKIGSYNKLGLYGVLETVFINPELGETYRNNLLRIVDNGHELGLHGGMNHATWQYDLNDMSDKQIEDLFLPAYNSFSKNFGKPSGFCSPGFVYNRYVLDLMDRFGFLYSSDMDGEAPFRPCLGEKQYSHLQVPVNIMGKNKVSFISQELAAGSSEKEIVSRALEEIRKRDIAVMYGHPAIEGIKASAIIREIILRAMEEDYRVVTVQELVRQIGSADAN